MTERLEDCLEILVKQSKQEAGKGDVNATVGYADFLRYYKCYEKL